MTLPILWHSNSPLATTGYGQQTALWTYRLVDHRKLAISAYYGLEGSPIRWSDKEILVFPGLGGDFGNDYLAGHADAFFGDPRAGLVITLMDILVLRPDILSQMNTACYMPVDHDPLTPAQREILTRSGAIPIAMSEFGREQLDHFGFEPLYVPHGVDTEIYTPQDKAEARKKVGADPDIFIAGICAANKGLPSRKAIHQSLQAFARLHEAHPGEVMLYLHTEMTGKFSRGLPIVDVMDSLGLTRDCVAMCDQHRLLFIPFSTDEMARIMSSLDVLLNPSTGGGFECAIIEAAACGVPTITTDFSAMPQVAGPSPWKVGGEREWTGQGSWQRRPSVDEIYECLEEAFEMRGTPAAEELSYDLRKHALDYDIDKVMAEHMLPTIEEIEERIGEQPSMNGRPAEDAKVAA